MTPLIHATCLKRSIVFFLITLLCVAAQSTPANGQADATVWFVPGQTMADSCDTPGAFDRLPLSQWHTTATPTSIKVPLLTFAIRNNYFEDDMLESVVLTSLNEIPWAIENIYLYADDDGDSAFSAEAEIGDILIGSLLMTGPFNINDQIKFIDVPYMIPSYGMWTVYFHVVVDIRADSVRAHLDDYDQAGLGVAIFSGDISLYKQGLASFDTIINPCHPTKPAGYNVILSTCDCSHQADCDDDGMINAVDVIHLINYAYRGGAPPPSDPECPALNRGEYNCDGRVDMLDVVKLVNYVYRYPAPGPCDPCAD